MSILQNFEKFKLKTKLVIGFSIVVFFSIAIAGAAFWSFDRLISNTRAIYEKDLIGVSYLRQLNRDLNIIGRVTNRYVLAINAGDAEGAKKSLATISETKKSQMEMYEKTKATIIRPALQEKLVALKADLEAYYAAIDNVIAATQGASPAIAGYKVISSKEYQDILAKVSSEIKEISTQKMQGAEDNLAKAIDLADHVKMFVGTMLTLAFLASL